MKLSLFDATISHFWTRQSFLCDQVKMKISLVIKVVVLLAAVFQGAGAGGTGRRASKNNEEAASGRNSTDGNDDDGDEGTNPPRVVVVLEAAKITGRKRHVNMNLPSICKPPKPTKRARTARTQANALLKTLGNAIMNDSGTMHPGILDALQGTELLPTFQAKALELEIAKRRDDAQSVQSYELGQLKNRFTKTILEHPTLGTKITEEEVDNAWNAIKDSIEERRFKEIEDDLNEVIRIGNYAFANPDEVCGPKIDKKKKREDDEEPDGLGGGGCGRQGLVAM